jgi:hypothetical protein
MNNIKTEYVNPPIPSRNFDWQATFNWQDGDDDLRGHGKTEADAVLDLLQNALAENTRETDDELVNMAFAHWEDKLVRQGE